MESDKNEAQILEEITFFISRFFVAELENPTEEDAKQASILAKLTLRLMAQMLERGMRKKQNPVFNVNIYVKDLGNGVGRMNYAFETIGGQLFEELRLGIMGEELEDGIKKWCEKTWGGKLTKEGANMIQAWDSATKQG